MLEFMDFVCRQLRPDESITIENDATNFAIAITVNKGPYRNKLRISTFSLRGMIDGERYIKIEIREILDKLRRGQ